MKKALKILLIIVAVLLALMIILPFAFKGKIVEAVKREANNNLNAQLDFSKVSLSLFRSFPNVSVGIQNLSLTGINDFEHDTLISAPSFRLTLDIMSVIKGSNYKIKEIVLQEPDVLLKVLSTGLANWDIVKPSADTAAPAEGEPSEMKIALKSVRINKGRLRYEDATLPMKMDARGVESKLSGDFTADRTNLDTQLSIDDLTVDYDGIRYLKHSKGELNTMLGADFNEMKFTFADAVLKVNAMKMLIDGFFAMPENGYDMDIAFKAPENDFKNILSLVPAIYTKDFESIDASGKVAFDGVVKGHYDDNTMPAFALNLTIDNGMFRYPDLPESVKNINVKAYIKSDGPDVDNTIVDVKQFHLEIASNPIDGRLYVITPVSDPQVDLAFKGKLNLNDVQKFYPLEAQDELSGMLDFDVAAKGRMSAIEQERYEDFDASGKIEAHNLVYKTTALPDGFRMNEGVMNISPQQASLKVDKALIGRNDFSLTGSIRNILGYFINKGELRGEVDLISSYLNINDFMTEPEATSAQTDTAAMGVIEVPANVDMTLRATVAEAIYDNLNLKQVKGLVKVKDEKIFLENLSMNTLGGSMALSGSYSVPQPQQPDIDFRVAIKTMEARQVAAAFNTIQMLAPIAQRAEGALSMDFNINSRLGADMMPVYPTLFGDGSLTSPRLAFIGVSSINKIADALKINELKDWVINNVNLSFEILDGKVFVKPFEMKLGQINTVVSGWNSFDQTLEYHMQMEIPRSYFGGAANNVLENLVSAANKKGANFSLGDKVPVKILITGLISDPKISTDLGSQVQGAVTDLKSQMEDALREKKEEAETRVREEVGKYIEEANVEAQKLLDQAQQQVDKLMKLASESAQKVQAEANIRADQLQAEGKKNGPIAELAAKKAAQKVREEGDNAGGKIIAEARQQGDNIMAKARQQADDIIQKAKDKAGPK
ncbi:MAG: AsmA-like C-terminal region-containing protein [Lentimicrobium sp.]|jgi:hypothetical protein|nr:AsmA-like C-terminal region-containing protein [Lentimicrobium sp.]